MYIRREREFFNERAHHTGPVEEAHARVGFLSRVSFYVEACKRATAFAVWRATGNGATGNIISSPVSFPGMDIFVDDRGG